MAEPEKQQIGDGSDNYGQAASQMAKAAKQAGQEAIKQTAVQGAEATANAAAATVQSAVEGGKAVTEIAAGTAAGGPWGAILSSVWALRHTLFKILISICLGLLILIVLIVSLPSIVSNGIFGLDGTQPVEGAALNSEFTQMADAVSDVIESGYDQSLIKVEEIIESGGYDYNASMEALINYAQGSAGFDVSYILSAYSASMQQQNTSKEDMIVKLNEVSINMFPITSIEKQQELIVPVSYSTFKPVTLTIVTRRTLIGIVNGMPQYRYDTEKQTYYLPDEVHSSGEKIVVDSYININVELPVYSNGKIVGTKTENYYKANGTETISPQKETVKYIECTIHPFDNTVITNAFAIDLNAKYGQFNITYAEAIQNMANALKMTLYGTLGSGQAVPLTDVELIEFVNRQNCNAIRKQILSTALSLVGRVPYFWGGKSAPGWNDEWNTPKLVTASGSSSSGTIRPYGLDCSGFTDWTYKTAIGVSLYEGSWNQWDNTYAIKKEELLPGDLGFMAVPGTVPVNHVLIFAGVSEDGKKMWVHCAGGSGVILNSPNYVTQFRRPKNVDFNIPGTSDIYGTPISVLEVEVTHYCACSKCCGANANGITASGKQVARGMVAMSSYYPFGTQIMINGTIYTVEDRGGAGIENSRNRVDIYVPNHNEALRLGRYKTNAKIYRMGR